MLHDRDYMNPGSGRRGYGGGQSGGGFLSTVSGKLIAVNVAIFLINEMNHGAMNRSLHLFGGAIAHGELWRFATYMFTHGGPLHLGLNMWVLYLFGKHVEQSMGTVRFCVLYVISGLASGALWFFLNTHARVPMVGASGSLMGVMVAAAVMYPDLRIMLIIPPIPMKLRTAVIAFAGVDLFLAVTGINLFGLNIAHEAHLGGLLGGLACMQWFGWRNQKSSQKKKRNRTHPARPNLSVVDPPMGDFDNRVDEILDKIGRQGMGSLTAEERQILDEARDRMKK